jgi:UDP-N-acetylmuramate dehydrogenase
MGIGGAVASFVEPENQKEFSLAIDLCRSFRIPFRVLGRGTNVIAADVLKPQAVISTRKLNFIFENGGYIVAECGAPLRRLAAFALERGRGGLAGLFDIPGSVGAAVRGNAGAFGDSVHRHLSFVKVYDAAKGRERQIPAAALSFGYRSSALMQMGEVFLLSAAFSFPKEDALRERERIRECHLARARTQPVSRRSCGSVFRRYDGVGAGFYLERAGCKGLCRGGAQISEKHANFILNSASATSDDVFFLIEEARERVYRSFGILLVPEVEKIM